MHFLGAPFDPALAQLSWDDIAGVQVKYKLVGMDQITGTISGTVTRDGTPVFGAFVQAVDENGLLAANAITLTDGTYKIGSLPPGNYTLYVEPLDGPMTPASVNGGIFSSAPMVTDFFPKFHNDSMAPTVTVASDETGVDFAVVQGNASIELKWYGTTPDPNAAFSVLTKPAEIFQGVDTNLIVGSAPGKGVDKLLDEGVKLLGNDLSPGSVARTGQFGNGDFFAVHPLDVPLDTPEGAHAIVLETNPETGVDTGGLEVFPPWPFLQAFAQFAHVADGSTTSDAFLINTNLMKGATAKLSARDKTGARTGITLGSLGQDANNDLDFSLNAGGSLSAKSGGGSTFVGSVRALADRFIVGTVLFESASGTTGVGASRPLLSGIAPVVIDNTKGQDTGLAITNLDNRPVKVFIQIQEKDGDAVASTIVDLAGNGQVALFIRQFESLDVLPLKFSGTVVITANRKIGATVIRTAPGVFTTFPIIQNRATTTSFYAQFAHAPASNLCSELLLVNPSPLRQATVQIRVRNSDGTAASVTLSGELLAAGTKTVTIPPLGCVVLKTEGAALFVGSVEVSSDPPEGNGIPVGGVVLFSSPDVGTAGVGESFPLSKAVMGIEKNTGTGTDTGIAVVNTKDQDLTLILTARDSEGTIVAGPKEITLKANNQLARFPNQDPLLLGLPNTFTGTLWIEVKEPGCEVALTVIRQSPGVLTTFPAVSPDLAVTPAD